MALIKCYECSKEISDKAPACPHCGAPKEEQPPQIEEAEILESVAVVDEPDAMINRIDEEGDLDLSHLTSPDGLELPKHVGGDLYLQSLDEYDQEVHGPGELGGKVHFSNPKEKQENG